MEVLTAVEVLMLWSGLNDVEVLVMWRSYCCGGRTALEVLML